MGPYPETPGPPGTVAAVEAEATEPGPARFRRAPW